MHIAMTVGATKVQILQENTLSAMTEQSPAQQEEEKKNSACEP